MRARVRLVRHQVRHRDWTLPPLRIAVLADPHVCAPWVTLADLKRIVAQVNALGPDIVVMAGDVLASRQLPGSRPPAGRIVPLLASLQAPLGVWSVLGNHDWWDCPEARAAGWSRNSVAEALAEAGMPLLRNSAVRVDHGGGFFLAGLDSQRPLRHRPDRGFHDPDLAFREVPDGAPCILLAHEPDYFAVQDPRAFLQISGHTHGGQMNLFGWRPMSPSPEPRFGWGHVRDGDRHLVVSGGIGFSGLPLRIFQPPEITLVTVTGAD